MRQEKLYLVSIPFQYEFYVPRLQAHIVSLEQHLWR